MISPLRRLAAATLLTLCAAPAAMPQATNLPARANTTFGLNTNGVVKVPATDVYWPTQTMRIGTATVTNLTAGTVSGIDGTEVTLLDLANNFTTNTVEAALIQLSDDLGAVDVSNYLLKTGGTLTGDVDMTYSQPVLLIASSDSFYSSLALSRTYDTSYPNIYSKIQTLEGTSGDILSEIRTTQINATQSELTIDVHGSPGSEVVKIGPTNILFNANLTAANITAPASVITAASLVGPLTGNVTGNVSGSAATFTSNLTGDVTSTGMTTVIGSSTVTSAMIVNGTVAAGDTSITGTPTGSKYLRDDWSWQTVSAGVAGSTGSTDNLALRADGAGGATLQSSDLSIEDVSTSTANNLQLKNNHAGQTNSSLVLTPKGSGAVVLGPRPDGTTTGGNARGTYAVDLQIVRSAAGYVAAGNYSGVLSGYSNYAASGYDAAVMAGGHLNGVSSYFGFVGGGENNVASGYWNCTLVGGESNGNAGSWSFLGAGKYNNIYTGSEYDFLGGGYNCDIWTTSDYCVLGGGLENTLDSCGPYCVLAGGYENNITGAANGALIGGGYLNDITSTAHYSVLPGGYDNNITSSGVAHTLSGGSGNTISGSAAYSTIPGGRNNVATASYGTAIGYDALAQWTGAVAISAGKKTTNGDRQAVTVLWSGTSTSATPVELFLGGDGSSVFSIPSNSVASYDLTVAVARSDTPGDTATYFRRGRIKNIAGTTTLVEIGAASLDDEDAGAAACSFALTAVDAATDYLKPSFTGEAAKTYQVHITATVNYLDF